MGLKKNDCIAIEIEDMGMNGEGIGHYDGCALFIKDTVIGDKALVKVMKMKKNYGYARLIELLVASDKRGTPKCEFYRSCGGCQLQALKYEEQLAFKQQKIENNLRRIGGFEAIPMEPIIGMDEPYFYRNKAQFPIGKDKQGNPIAGFYAGRTHDIIANTNCYLGAPENQQILETILSFMKENGVEPYDEASGTGIVRHVLIRKGFATDEIMVCLVVNSKSLPHADLLIEQLCKLKQIKSISLNHNQQQTNVIMGEELTLLYGSSYIRDYIGDIAFQISPLSFYQVNPGQTKKLYDCVLKFAAFDGSETVWDLYCGIGTISLYMARHVKQVYGVEIVPQAIEDAKANAAFNNIHNAEFIVGKAEETLPAFYENKKNQDSAMRHPDVIVVDPPRKGCDPALLETIVKMQPKRVVYVSCDSATLARDLKYLCANGFELKRVQGVDQFGQSVHVEVVCLLSKLRTKQNIEVELEMSELDLMAAESKATYEESRVMF